MHPEVGTWGRGTGRRALGMACPLPLHWVPQEGTRLGSEANSGPHGVTQCLALGNWITERLSKLPKVCCLRSPRGPWKYVPVLVAAGLRGGGMCPGRVQSFLFPSAALSGLPACWNVAGWEFSQQGFFPVSNRVQLEPGDSSWLGSVPILSGRCKPRTGVTWASGTLGLRRGSGRPWGLETPPL